MRRCSTPFNITGTLPVVRIHAIRSALVIPGAPAFTAAAYPATCGAACEVPPMLPNVVALALSEETTILPGARKKPPVKFAGSPRFEKALSWSPVPALSVDATLIGCRPQPRWTACATTPSAGGQLYRAPKLSPVTVKPRQRVAMTARALPGPALTTAG